MDLFVNLLIVESVCYRQPLQVRDPHSHYVCVTQFYFITAIAHNVVFES